jgi:hypothetical protein
MAIKGTANDMAQGSALPTSPSANKSNRAIPNFGGSCPQESFGPRARFCTYRFILILCTYCTVLTESVFGIRSKLFLQVLTFFGFRRLHSAHFGIRSQASWQLNGPSVELCESHHSINSEAHSSQPNRFSAIVRTRLCDSHNRVLLSLSSLG